MSHHYFRTLLLWWLVLVVLASVAFSQSYDFGTDISKLTRRDDSKGRIVVGRLPTPANSTVPFRLEIRKMKSNEYTWDLYILALSMFQYADQDDPLSWYQIAGKCIHGVPFTTWNGVESLPGTNQSGYCTHSSVLFPMWHRPYLALFEQQMYKMVNAIALMFANTTERSLYQRAASTFRTPYWDWSLQAPDGETHLPDLKQWNETKRAPNTTASLTSPPSDNEVVNKALLSKLPELQQRLYILFSNYHEFNSFSNKAWAVSQGLSLLDSIESIHDVVHIYGGSQGHLTYVPLSSFDPLFFLHHTMTDRLITIWQILNPSSWVRPMPAGETSFTALKGTMQSSESALTPFFATDDGIFWNSDMARSTDAFGYAYADTFTKSELTQDLRDALIKKINIWYGSSSPAGLMGKTTSSGLSSLGAKRPMSVVNGGASFRPNIRYDAADPPASHIFKENQYTEWVANIKVNVEALDGSFVVHFFLGSPPPNEDDWHLAPNLVGTVAIFAMNRMTGSDSKISGAVPLTWALMKMVAAGEIYDLTPEEVQPFLADALYFAVQSSNNSHVDPRQVNGLHIAVASSNVQVPRSQSELPEWDSSTTRLRLWPQD
ncbi:tyrosinase precursor [Metarhizium rileyi]|uniref:Tyrosinase n=1 Tax=Metarhizium rileyi (strain RCEF 4871) TaxID=1649241 RepID=A0A166ZG70_METRR|nr:tyrosinase precursor [Metarhizium rileyi RCEF 4871]